MTGETRPGTRAGPGGEDSIRDAGEIQRTGGCTIGGDRRGEGEICTVARPLRSAYFGYAGVIGALHALGLAALLFAATTRPVLLGMGFLAYTLGLRHAFDVDHIAAIDNTVRKLMQQGQDSLGVGFYFSLGHSTVVCCMAVAVGLIAQWAQRALPHLQIVGGVVGTVVSGAFLIIIGLVNLFIWIEIYVAFWRMRGGEQDAEDLERLLVSRGLIARLARPLFQFITRSWQIYPVGFLFGLGFDTASEVALLALSAGAAASALPMTGILALPLLFTAGMTLVDTTDGVFMTTAYRWAFTTALRKVYYNLTITGLSVIAALLIGFVELTQVLAQELQLNTGFWRWLQGLDLGTLGYLLVGLFVLTWGLSYGAWKFLRIEERWETETTARP